MLGTPHISLKKPETSAIMLGITSHFKKSIQSQLVMEGTICITNIKF